MYIYLCTLSIHVVKTKDRLVLSSSTHSRARVLGKSLPLSCRQEVNNGRTAYGGHQVEAESYAPRFCRSVIEC